MTLLERLKWSVLALAQPADIQESLFPDFVLVADELALNWEQALDVLNSEDASFTPHQKESIETLDGLILAISGSEHLEFWIDDALRTFPEWEQIRFAAAAVARSFGWPIEPPPPSPDIYIGLPKDD